MGKITINLQLVVVLLSIMSCLFACNDAKFMIVVEAPTPVYEDYPKSGPPTSKVITVLDKGETRTVIHSRHSKDCEYLKIRLKDGQTGYVGWSGKYKVMPIDKEN